MAIATNPSTGEVVFLDKDNQWKPAQTSVNPETKEMLAFDGAGWSPVPASGGVFKAVDDAVRSIASGITFGWADEFAAKMDELTGRGTYDENVKQERARDAQIPVTIQLPGEIAGAVGATVLTAPLAALRAMAAVKQLPQWMKFGALGAGEGALAGAGGAEEGGRLAGAGVGSAVGAPIGAAAPSVVQGVTSAISGTRAALSPKAGAAADIGRAIVRDETTPAEMAGRFSGLQSDRPGVATVADVGGENVKGLVERVAQTPGAGRTQVVPSLTERQTQQAARITNDLRSLTGTNTTASKAVEDIMAQRASAAKPLYEEAMTFASGPASTEALEVGITRVAQTFNDITATGFGKQIVNSARFKNAIQTEYGIEDVSQAPLMTLIDTFKKQVDDLTGAALKKGENNTARILTKMNKGLLEVVDEVNPAYAKAREAWSGPSKFLDAIEEGRNILSTKVDADGVAAKFNSLSAGEQEAFRIGAISSIVGKMGNDGARMADMTKYLRSPEARAKVAAIMPTDEAAAAWGRRLDYEVGTSELTARSLGNSATARRLAEKEDAQGVVGDLVWDALKGGVSTSSVLKTIFTAGPKWLRDTLRSRTDRELADILTNPDRMQDLPDVIRRASKMQGVGTSGGTAAAAVTGAGVAATE